MPPVYHKSQTIRNVPLGVHQKIARQADDPFIPSAAGSWRQFRSRSIGDVYADNGEVAVLEFPNIRTSISTDAFCAVGVRVRADAFCEHVRT
jgi:hypothetical protein